MAARNGVRAALISPASVLFRAVRVGLAGSTRTRSYQPSIPRRDLSHSKGKAGVFLSCALVFLCLSSLPLPALARFMVRKQTYLYLSLLFSSPFKPI